MAASPDALELTVAAATYQDMLKMVEGEKRLRKALLHWVGGGKVVGVRRRRG